MGYESALHLIDVKIRKKALSRIEADITAGKEGKDPALGSFLEYAAIDIHGFLAFRAKGDGADLYEPCEGEDAVPAMVGKWREAEAIARWIKTFSCKGGRIVLHSLEADGAAWGWEFDGKGRMRHLDLCACGEWE